MRYIERLKELIGKKGFLAAAVILGSAGMLLIMLSGISDDGRSGSKVSESSAASQNNAYRTELEAQLKAVLSEISGVGDTEVMITLSAGEEYVYAEESSIDGDKRKSEFVIADKSGIVTKVKAPQITGAVIVCKGGDNPRVCEQVYKAASVALGIPSSRICVVKMK